MPSVPRVTSFLNALDVMVYLHRHGRAPSGALRRALKTTEGSIYRLLKTLLGLGYIEKTPNAQAYQLSARSRSLAYGYDDETWPEEVARPILKRLSEKIQWPAAFGAIEGPYVHVRATSDESSHFVLKQLKAGRRVPLFKSAIGWVSLAASPAKTRARLRRNLELATKAADLEMPSAPTRDRTLNAIAARGYHCVGDHKTRQIVLAVPVVAAGRVLGGVSIRVYVAGSNADVVVRRYLKIVQDASSSIAADYIRWAAS